MESPLKSTKCKYVYQLEGSMVHIKVGDVEVVIERGEETVTVSLYPERDGDFPPLEHVYVTNEQARTAQQVGHSLYD